VKVHLGIPYFGHNDPNRQRAYEYVARTLSVMYPWSSMSPLQKRDVTNRGAARNQIAQEALDAGADVMVICDADSFPTSDGLLTAIGAVQIAGGLHFAFDRYRALTRSATALVYNGRADRALQKGYESECLGSSGGCVVMRPQQWFDVGGSPEFQGWGFEDIVFAVQAMTFLGDMVWHTGYLTHMWHPKTWRIGDPDYDRNIAVCKEYEANCWNQEKIRELLQRDGRPATL